MTDKRQKAVKVKWKHDEPLTKQSIFVEYSLLQKKHLSFSGAHSQLNTTLYQNRPGETEDWTNLRLEPHDYRIYYVNIDLCLRYGISVAELQTFLLAKRPSRWTSRNVCHSQASGQKSQASLLWRKDFCLMRQDSHLEKRVLSWEKGATRLVPREGVVTYF